MKVTSTLLSLFALGNVALSAPTANPPSDLVGSNQSPSVEGLAHAELDKRLNMKTCKAVGRAIWASADLVVANMFVTESSTAVKKICERHDKKECALYVDDLNDAWGAIFKIGYAFKFGAVAVDKYNSIMSSEKRRSVPEDDFRSHLEDALREDGHSYDYFEDLGLPSSGVKARDNEPALTHRFMLRNWSHPESNSTAARDFAIHRFEDGSGKVHFQPAAGASGNATSSPLTKRHDGAGVKVAFKHERVSFMPGKTDISGAKLALTRRWQTYAYQGVGEMFGFVEHDNKSFFYYRTIIETKGFGSNYESVDDCGNLGKYVGTYLGSGN